MATNDNDDAVQMACPTEDVTFFFSIPPPPRLRDGSEYLLNASSRFMLKKWMMKIQASTGERCYLEAIDCYA